MNLTNLEDILEPFNRLIQINIQDETVSVPENNYLLRCLQFLQLEAISMGDFCWNGNCANCQVWVITDNGEKPVLSCRTRVQEGMKISRMSDTLEAIFIKPAP
jgi:NADH dehydrogenase/NADH:ubiquinone oxidoreductase subunit G